MDFQALADERAAATLYYVLDEVVDRQRDCERAGKGLAGIVDTQLPTLARMAQRRAALPPPVRRVHDARIYREHRPAIERMHKALEAARARCGENAAMTEALRAFAAFVHLPAERASSSADRKL